MIKSGFDFTEFSQYVQNLGIAKQDFRIWLKTFLLQQAQRVVRQAKLRQRAVGAIDTGAMINSWYIGKEKIELKTINGKSKSGRARVTKDLENSSVQDIRVVGNVLEVVIGNSMEYASFIEYGHHSYEGKYLLTIAIDTVQNALQGRFNSEFKKFLKDKGVV